MDDNDKMNDKFLEKINDIEYDYMIRSLEHLTKHPYSMRAKSFIEEFTQELPEQSLDIDLPELIRDEATGQIYTDLQERVRQCTVQVKTILNGTGKFQLGDHDILFFDEPYIRAMVFHPLRLTNMQDKVDIHADIVVKPQLLGHKSVAQCIRLAMSRTLAAYVDPELRERLRLAGLLTRDLRAKERKKFGQMRARRKYTWKKR